MADVRRPEEDRGQLILVTGLLVAVTMVSLVLLLNTAIFTENLASRGMDQSGREAVEYRNVMHDEIGELIERENQRELGGWSTVRETTRDGVLLLDNRTARTYATTGTVVGVNRSTLVLHEGKVIRQTNTTRRFTDNNNVATWTLGTAIERTRAFSMTVERASLEPSNESQADVNTTFRVVLTDGGNTWTAYVYENRSTNDIALASQLNAGSIEEHCRVNAAETTLNLSAGTIAGQSCDDFEWAEGLSSAYTIDYVNGDSATGTYELTVNVEGAAAVNTANLHDGTSTTDSPYYVPAVYSVTFDGYFETPTLTYRAPIRVAPGEPP